MTVPMIEKTEADAGERCDACSHPMHLHDQTGRRYCAATLTMARPRGCICKIN
jgi:hypothetical protein